MEWIDLDRCVPVLVPRVEYVDDDGAEDGAEPDGALADGAVTAEVLPVQRGHVVAELGAGHDVRQGHVHDEEAVEHRGLHAQAQRRPAGVRRR